MKYYLYCFDIKPFENNFSLFSFFEKFSSQYEWISYENDFYAKDFLERGKDWKRMTDWGFLEKREAEDLWEKEFAEI